MSQQEPVSPGGPLQPAASAETKQASTGQRPAKKPPSEESLSPFSVTVGQVYDGPLDLLLDLIRKQDIDIYDIPIARITAQFLAYVENLKQTDVDAAGEFIYTASLLIHIKSRMLLPRSPAEPAGEDEDPRRELVERLLEHERFKNAAQMLLQKQQIEEATWTSRAPRDFLVTDGDTDFGTDSIAVDTVDLARALRTILERMRTRPVLNFDEEAVTVGQMIDYVRRRLLLEDRPVALKAMLRSVLRERRSERALICIFLALLELVRLQAILLRQDRAFSEILIKKSSSFDQVMTETLAARDDWR
jgi:segregation and condensation protein A